MKILFIAPIPPPIDGQSKATKVLLDALIDEGNTVKIINLSKKQLSGRSISLGRLFDILEVSFRVWKNRKNNDVIFLSLAESFFGNLRDLLIYLICHKSNSKIFVHMLGGAGMKKILERKSIQQKINSFFISKIGGVIVEGTLNFEVFSKVINEEKIHIVPNFAENFLFVNDEEIKSKFFESKNIQILYLSNLIPGKGYIELADAYISLTEEQKKEVNIEFVGGFGSEKDEEEFLNKIKHDKGLNYLGKFIDGEKKRELYCKSHVFCLPTYYPFEGQPISILEAYATGCVVITSNHSGIPFIFSDKKNGFMVEKGSVSSVKRAIEEVLLNKDKLEGIAFSNRNEALERYRTSIYQTSMLRIFRNFLSN